MSQKKQSIKSLIKGIVYFIVSGIIFTWALFWYLSGSVWGGFQFMYTYYVASKYAMEAPSKDALFIGSLEGMIHSLHETYSVYLNRDKYEKLMEHTSGTYSGIGVVLTKGKDNLPEVLVVMEGQPAEKAGLKEGDVILAIDGKPTKDIPFNETSDLVRGEAGTTVTLTIKEGEGSKDIQITRETIQVPTVKGEMMEDGIGYIRISQFGDSTGEDFQRTYDDLEKKGMKKLILDLRDNPGGLLTAAQEVGDYILPAGTMVTVQTRNGPIRDYESKGAKPQIPLVVLINKGSASASEIVAGAVQDEKVGTIVGVNSYGKGTVQSVIPVAGDGGGIKVTIARYHTPNDRVIDGIGIKPDVEVVEDKNSTADNQLAKAMEIIKAK